jgi:NTE family protein
VLSGGGSAGAAQVGMLRALLEAGIVPSLLVGCSVGALNAAFVAMDPTLDRVRELETLWRGLDRKAVFGSGRAQAVTHLLRRDAHLYEPDGLLGIIERFVPLDDLAKTAVPCHVVTTDLESGRPAFWSSGDPRTVLAASACLPAIFPPVLLAGALHVDGGVSCPLPITRALDLGATTVWALDVSGGSVGRRGERMTALDVLLLSFSISRRLLNTGAGVAAAADPRVVRLPEVDLGTFDIRDFSRTSELVDAGYAAARARLASVPVPVPRAASRAGARAG